LKSVGKDKYEMNKIRTVRTIVDNINCIFKVLSTLSKVLTLMMSVERILIKIQIRIPKPMRFKGNMKLDIMY